MLVDGKLDDREVEIEVTPQSFPMFEMMRRRRGMEGMDINFTEMLQEMLPKRKKRRTVKVPEARRVLVEQELKKLVDMDDVGERRARPRREPRHHLHRRDRQDRRRAGPGRRARTSHAKACSATCCRSSKAPPSRPGTAWCGPITSSSSPPARSTSRSRSDLIPELQGRFPIRVELKPLTEQDFVRIMTEPENALTKQYAALVAAEGAELEFTADGIAEIARMAFMVNERMENIGARRLHTVMTTLLEDVLFELPD